MKSLAVFVVAMLLPGLTGPDETEDPLTDEAPIVAMLDSGIDPTHSEFSDGQLVAFKDFINGEEDPYDDRGHGTAVASRVAGETLGAYPEARLAMAKVLSSTGGLPDYDLLGDAIRWAVEDADADVISVSIGTTAFMLGDPSNANEAIREAHEAGVLVVWAAGNWRTFGSGPPTNPVGDNPTTLLSGAGVSSPHALLVGAADEEGDPWEQSAIIPDVLAWGANVPVARPGDEIAPLSGSSFAAPYVAGGAAMLLNEDPGLTAGELSRLLRTTAQDRSEFAYHEEGYGLVDEDRLALAVGVVRGDEAMPLRPVADAHYVTFTAARSAMGASPHVDLTPRLGSVPESGPPESGSTAVGTTARLFA